MEGRSILHSTMVRTPEHARLIRGEDGRKPQLATSLISWARFAWLVLQSA
jgi:hypothetical protein